MLKVSKAPSSRQGPLFGRFVRGSAAPLQTLRCCLCQPACCSPRLSSRVQAASQVHMCISTLLQQAYLVACCACLSGPTASAPAHGINGACAGQPTAQPWAADGGRQMWVWCKDRGRVWRLSLPPHPRASCLCCYACDQPRCIEHTATPRTVSSPVCAVGMPHFHPMTPLFPPSQPRPPPPLSCSRRYPPRPPPSLFSSAPGTSRVAPPILADPSVRFPPFLQADTCHASMV